MKDVAIFYEGTENMTNSEISNVDAISEEKETREEISKEKLENIKDEMRDLIDDVLNSDLKSLMALDVLLLSGVIGIFLGFILGLVVPNNSDVISHYMVCMICMIFIITPFVALYKQKPAIVIKAMKILGPVWRIYGFALLICLALPFGIVLIIPFACISFPIISYTSIAIIFGTSVSVWINSLISFIFLLLTKWFPIPEKIANIIILVVDVIALIVFIAIPFVSIM